MKKTFLIVAALVSFTTFAFAEDFFPIAIDVAPNVLNLQSGGDYVTVHTNIADSLVDTGSVKLFVGDVDGDDFADPDSCFSDDRGYFVAQFLRKVVGDIVESGDYNTFILTGLNKSGKIFSGEQNILVVDNVPKGPR